MPGQHGPWRRGQPKKRLHQHGPYGYQVAEKMRCLSRAPDLACCAFGVAAQGQGAVESASIGEKRSEFAMMETSVVKSRPALNELHCGTVKTRTAFDSSSAEAISSTL